MTGTGTQHLLRTAPVQTEVITRLDLEQYGGRSIEEILGGLSASFDFSEDDMGSQMQMNGLGNAYILVLVDGKRLHGDNGGENDLGQIDPARIERIEIVKGAASALYGSDAIAGVINIITRRQESNLQIENDTRGGSYGDLRQHNGVGLSLGPVRSFTNFHFRRTDGWRNFEMEAPERYGGRSITNTTNQTVSHNQLWQLAERLSMLPAKGMEVYAEGMLYHKHIFHPRGGDSEVAHYYDLSYDDAAAAAGWSWNTKGGNILTADVTWNRHAYYYDYTSLYGVIDETDPSPYAAIYFDGDRILQSDQRHTMVQLKGVFALPRQQRLSLGYDYRYDWLKASRRVADGTATDWTQARTRTTAGASSSPTTASSASTTATTATPPTTASSRVWATTPPSVPSGRSTPARPPKCLSKRKRNNFFANHSQKVHKRNRPFCVLFYSSGT